MSCKTTKDTYTGSGLEESGSYRSMYVAARRTTKRKTMKNTHAVSCPKHLSSVGRPSEFGGQELKACLGCLDNPRLSISRE